jgi:copper chaperone
MSTTTVTVTGMNCGHCATSVREEIGDIPGVHTVDVDLASGNVTIDSDSAIEAMTIRTAVEDAGYQLAG